LLLLKCVPVVIVVAGKQFDDIFDFMSAIVADALTTVGSREAEILALNIPTTMELGDIDFVEIKSARLTGRGMTAPTRRGVSY
jgi:hypothetical protein